MLLKALKALKVSVSLVNLIDLIIIIKFEHTKQSKKLYTMSIGFSIK